MKSLSRHWTVNHTQLYCAACVRDALGDELYADLCATDIGYLGMSFHEGERPFVPQDVYVDRCPYHGPLADCDIHYVKERYQDVLV